MPSTATCLTRNSSATRSPATCCRRRSPAAINKDGLVATGLLAIADFVPGDVDKDQMIADYVNDQIDVVGRAFLGLTVACARCHDHKFDPISTEDYYALAGIFFSTRLIPGPVPGNTPLVRVPLCRRTSSPSVQAQDAADNRRRAELEQQLPDAADRAYRRLPEVASLTEQTARYLVAACEYRQASAGGTKPSLAELAKRHGLDEGLLAGWVAYLDRVETQPVDRTGHPTLRDAAAGKLAGSALEEAAGELQQALAALAKRDEAEVRQCGGTNRALAAPPCSASGRMIRISLTDADGRVMLWPNRSGLPADARPLSPGGGPVKTDATINGHAKAVLRFDGNALLEAPRRVPAGRQPVRRLPDRGHGRQPASACSAGKIPTSASTGWA